MIALDYDTWSERQLNETIAELTSYRAGMQSDEGRKVCDDYIAKLNSELESRRKSEIG